MELIIDRKTWYRGMGASGSALLRDDGTRCCVGFFGAACGVPDEQLLDVQIAAKVKCGADRFPRWALEKSHDSMAETNHLTDIAQLYEINDDTYLSGAKREWIIIKIFARHDVQVRFVD